MKIQVKYTLQWMNDMEVEVFLGFKCFCSDPHALLASCIEPVCTWGVYSTWAFFHTCELKTWFCKRTTDNSFQSNKETTASFLDRKEHMLLEMWDQNGTLHHSIISPWGGAKGGANKTTKKAQFARMNQQHPPLHTMQDGWMNYVWTERNTFSLCSCSHS